MHTASAIHLLLDQWFLALKWKFPSEVKFTGHLGNSKRRTKLFLTLPLKFLLLFSCKNKLKKSTAGLFLKLLQPCTGSHDSLYSHHSFIKTFFCLIFVDMPSSFAIKNTALHTSCAHFSQRKRQFGDLHSWRQPWVWGGQHFFLPQFLWWHRQHRPVLAAEIKTKLFAFVYFLCLSTYKAHWYILNKHICNYQSSLIILLVLHTTQPTWLNNILFHCSIMMTPLIYFILFLQP